MIFTNCAAVFKNIGILLLFLIASLSLRSQVLPKEGKVLNYRIIGFSFPASQVENKYKIEIAEGNYNDTGSFKQHIVKTQHCKGNKEIVEVPSFGMQYTWRVMHSGVAPDAADNILYHFSTGNIQEATDTLLIRLRILKHAVKYKDAFVFIDDSRALYDMNGRPVWFLPKPDSNNTTVCDMKLSPQGTITLLAGDDACEMNYDGEILWKAPNKGRPESEHYHHQFTRLANGHYMALYDEVITVDSTTVPFGAIEEYDEKGNTVWSWKSSGYYKQKWLQYRDRPLDMYGNTRANAFFLDDRTKMLYVSFKNISQVLKVKYPGGDVLNAYGKSDTPDTIGTLGRLFYMQHACNVSEQGYLYLLNNVSQPKKHPRIMMMDVSGTQKGKLKTIWEYNYPVIDTYKQKFSSQPGSKITVGGNVTELPDRSVFASLCVPYNNIFIVSRDKKLLWDAVPERRLPGKMEWATMPTYRASIIKSRKDLERLIWHSEKALTQG